MSTHECEEPPIPAQHDSLHQRITHATTGIRHWKQRLVDFLYDRATASAACAHFQTALRDATEIQTLMPSSPMGFLCQGDIHRQQGRQTAAIEAYEEGLALSSSSSLEGHQHVYDQLRCHKKDAEYACSKRIDFITQLPMEIVHCFIIPKIMNDPLWFAHLGYSYLYVSRAWRQHILDIDGGIELYVRRPYQEIDQLASFAPYVGSLEMEVYCTAPNRSNIFDGVQFSSLKRLHMKIYFGKDLCDLFKALGSTSSSNLTHLKINNLFGAVVRMEDVLSSCPRLQELVFRIASTIDFTGVPQQAFPSLKVLRMFVQDGSFVHEEALPFLKRLPALEYLEIFPWPESRALTDIQQHCPSLKSLQYAFSGTHQYWDDFPLCPSQPGLQRIQIHDAEGNHYDPHAIDTLLKNNHHTVRVLDLCIGRAGKPMALAFPLLRRMVIANPSTGANTCYGSWIPKNAPNVEELELDIRAIHKCPSLIESLQCIKNLRKMRFDLGKQPVHPYHEHVHRFMKQQIHMESLKLEIHPDIFHDGGAWLTAIHNMPKLRCLDLLIRLPVPGTFAQFMKGVSMHCPLLERLHVLSDGGITDEAMVYLVKLKHLNHIILPISDMSRMAIISFGTMEALKTIMIIPGPEDDTEALRLLNESRHDIICIPSPDLYH